MMLTVYDNLLNLERDIDRLLSGFGGSGSYMPAAEFPVMDVADYPEETVLVMDLPGVRREDLQIKVEKGLLTISGERAKASVPEGGVWIRNESPEGRFGRSIQLPQQIKADAISAELKDGVLRIVLPKAEEVKPREIVIR